MGKTYATIMQFFIRIWKVQTWYTQEKAGTVRKTITLKSKRRRAESIDSAVSSNYPGSPRESNLVWSSLTDMQEMDPDKTVVCTVESPNRKMTRRMTIRRRTSSHSPERRNSRSPERLSNADGKPGPQTRRQ